MYLYKVKLLGKGMVMVNDNYLWEIEAFIQSLRDRDKELTFTMGRLYGGE